LRALKNTDIRRANTGRNVEQRVHAPRWHVTMQAHHGSPKRKLGGVALIASI
jgi:hypothetical protein